MYGLGYIMKKQLEDLEVTQQQVAEWIGKPNSQSYVSKCLNEEFEFTPSELNIIAEKIKSHKKMLNFYKLLRRQALGMAVEPAVETVFVH